MLSREMCRLDNLSWFTVYSSLKTLFFLRDVGRIQEILKKWSENVTRLLKKTCYINLATKMRYHISDANRFLSVCVSGHVLLFQKQLFVFFFFFFL